MERRNLAAGEGQKTQSTALSRFVQSVYQAVSDAPTPTQSGVPAPDGATKSDSGRQNSDETAPGTKKVKPGGTGENEPRGGCQLEVSPIQQLLHEK